MACVLALTADLLFGSRIQGSLAAAGQDLELLADAQRLRERLADPAAAPAQLLIVDLTDSELDGAALIESLRHDGSSARRARSRSTRTSTSPRANAPSGPASI